MYKLIYILPVLLMLSCGSRKRELQQIVSKFDFKSQIDTSAKVAIRAELLQNQTQSVRQRFLNTRIKYQGKAGDSLTVQKFGPDGKLQSEYKFKGTGSADLSEQESDTDLNKITQSSHNTQTNIEASGSKKLTASGSTKAKAVKVERTGFNVIYLMVSIVIMLIIILLSYKRFKNHVLNKK